MLGAILAVLSALAFGLNYATARRGMVSGTPNQAMVISVPLGMVLFATIAATTGGISRIMDFPLAVVAWMAAFGLVHFIFGRYCNYRANQAAGVNLTAPVIQLNIIVTLVLAVIVLRESCSVLQMTGAVLIVAGSITTQRQSTRSKAIDIASPSSTRPAFVPRVLVGYLFATLAALAYGTSPILARFALAETGAATGILGGLIAYGTATAIVALLLVQPTYRREVKSLARLNARWFAYSGLCVAIAQGFFFAALAVAPVMLVTPLLQLSLVFALILSKWLNPAHESLGLPVVAGAVISIVGALSVSIPTEFILDTLGVPQAAARVLGWRL